MSNRYWFRPKRWGYGATPITWEGWTVSIGAGAVLLGSIVFMNGVLGRGHVVGWVTWTVVVIGLTVWLVRLCRDRTEGEWKWRWGRRANERLGGRLGDPLSSPMASNADPGPMQRRPE